MKIIGMIAPAPGATKNEEAEALLRKYREDLSNINPVSSPEVAEYIADKIKEVKESLLASGTYAPVNLDTGKKGSEKRYITSGSLKNVD